MLGLLVAPAFCGCSDDNGSDSKEAKTGADINFSLAQTRTAYDADDQYQINWVNGDQVRIYCDEAEDVKNAIYTVNQSIEDNKENEGTLAYNSAGLKWGSDTGTHNFYAVYPADDSKVSVSNGIAKFSINQNQTCTISTTPTDGNYVAEPDMTNAYMVASLSTTPVDNVNLAFKPIMTTLKVKVKGRSTDYTGENGQTVTITGISVLNDNVRSSDSNAGTFQYDIANGTIYNSGTSSTTSTEITYCTIKNGSVNYLDLGPGESVTFTIFLPPLPINSSNQVTVRVHATGETTQEVTIGDDANLNIEASAKATINMPDYPTEDTGNYWITPLDDNIYVSQLSIPGTHDAATMDCSLNAGKCQSRSISEQLEMGIRCFDLRPAAPIIWPFFESSSALPIYHGTANCDIDLRDVYDTFNTFLEAHPGEFIITILRWEEERALSSESRFNSAMNTFVGSTRYTSHALESEYCKKDVTIGEMRGKILTIMRPNQGSDPDEYFTNTAPAGMMFVSGFPGSHATGTQQAYLKTQYVDYGDDQWGSHTDWILYCQNYYQVASASDVSSKIASVETYLDYARDNAAACNHYWTINHCSGYIGSSININVSGTAYARLGQEVNLPVYNYLMDENRTVGSTGIVLLDFVGDRICQSATDYTVYGDLLPQAIIDNNYKFRMIRKGE